MEHLDVSFSQQKDTKEYLLALMEVRWELGVVYTWRYTAVAIDIQAGIGSNGWISPRSDLDL